MGKLRRVKKVLWRFFLAILGFGCGLFFAFLFYEFCLKETDLGDSFKLLIFIGSSVVLSVGFSISRHLTCISLLTLPELAGRAGRRTLQATILILVIAGPIHNLGENGEETLRFFGCVKDMLWEIFMAGVDLVIAPIQNILSDLKKSAEEKQHDSYYNASHLQDVVMKPVWDEVEGEEETRQLKADVDEIDRAGFLPDGMHSDQIEKEFRIAATDDEKQKITKQYKKKVAYRCEEIFAKGLQSCIQVFQNKYLECEEEMPFEVVAWILCWPMKLEFICNILNEFSMGSTCEEAEGLIDDNFGEAYTFTKKGIDDFTQSFKFRINYQGLSEIANFDSISEKRDELLEQFLDSKTYVEWYLTMLKRCLSLSYIMVIFSAISYHRHYFRKLSFDNQYLTKYFLKIDRRRLSHRKSNLLPIKSFEKAELISVKRFLLTSSERKRFLNQLFCICLQAGVVFTIFALDRIYTELLTLLQNHAEIEFKQEGTHVFAIQVTGEGYLSHLMRKIVKDFEVQEEIDMKHFTKACLPNPRVVDSSYSQRIMLLFFVLFWNAYFEAHSKRLRHCIADYVFPKRYKRRTVWLYNEMLRNRRRQLLHLKRKALENSERFRVFMPKNPLQLLSHYFPRRCGCLKRLKMARRKCLLCLSNGAIHRCPRCGFSYCKLCFKDVNEQCLYCIAKQEEDEEKNEQHFLDSSENDANDNYV